MEPFTFMSLHLIVMFVEALVGSVLLLASAPGGKVLCTLSHIAALWQVGYVLSEPFLLIEELFPEQAAWAGVIAGPALAWIGVCALTLTIAGGLSLCHKGQRANYQPPSWLRLLLLAGILLSGVLSILAWMATGKVLMAQAVGLLIYSAGRIPLAIFWINAAMGGCCCGGGIRRSRSLVCAAIGGGLFLFSMLAGVVLDAGMMLGWLMLPTSTWAVWSTDKAGGFARIDGDSAVPQATALAVGKEDPDLADPAN